MFSGPLVYATGGLLVVCLVLGGVVWVQHGRLQAYDVQVDTYKMAVDAWERKVQAKEQTIATLRAKIEEQNAAVEQGAEWGRLAAERQATIDRLMAQLARAEDDLRVVAEKYRQLREQAVGMSECQTYRLALEAIAGVVP